MIETQLKSRGIKDPLVLAAMGKIPRHLFVDKSQRDFAYEDGPLPIGFGQTISQPYIVAYMTELLKLKKESRVLEIGTGSGYQTAVLAEIAKEIFSIEIVPDLGKSAAGLLASLKYENVFCKIGDGYGGWPETAPFDGIIVTAAPDHVPPALIDQLKPGGRLVIPVGITDNAQMLELIEKKSAGDLSRQKTLPVRFVPLTRNTGNQ